MTRPAPGRRSDYFAFETLQTRWEDNDAYGHMNNAVHYRLVDTFVNNWLLGAGLLHREPRGRIGLVVESGCRYHAEMAYPDRVVAGLRVGKIGTSSVRWEVGLFPNDMDQAAAEAHFTHVFVNSETRRPEALPDTWREVLQPLLARTSHIAKIIP